MKIIKNSSYFENSYEGIWVVNEFTSYPLKRKKNVNGKIYETGLAYTITELNKYDTLYKVLIVTTLEFSSNNPLIDIEQYFDLVILTSNKGRDIGALQRVVYFFLGKVARDTPFIFSNSSFRPPKNLNILELVNHDILDNCLIGASIGFGPRYFILKPLHVQSNFFMSSFGNIADILTSLRPIEYVNKRLIILFGELAISKKAFEKNLHLVVINESGIRIFSSPIYSFKSFDERVLM